WDRAGRDLDGADALEERVAATGDDGAARDVAVATEVLRRGVDDEIGAQRERALEYRGRGGVVADAASAGPVGERGDRRDVGDAPQRIGRRLDPDDLGGRPERGLHRRRVRHVHEVDGQTPRREDVA